MSPLIIRNSNHRERFKQLRDNVAIANYLYEHERYVPIKVTLLVYNQFNDKRYINEFCANVNIRPSIDEGIKIITFEMCTDLVEVRVDWIAANPYVIKITLDEI